MFETFNVHAILRLDLTESCSPSAAISSPPTAEIK